MFSRPMNVFALALFMSFTLGACSSSGPKAPVASTANPTEEVSRMEADLNASYEAQHDILAPNEMAYSQKHLSKAKKAMNDGDKQNEVLEQIALSRGYLEKARAKAEGKGENLDGIMRARRAAIAAGARNFPKQNDRLASLDKQFRRQSARPDKMDAEDFGELQRDYGRLQRDATQATQLGTARARIEGAVKDGAKRRAPKTLEQARKDMVNAENFIAANLANPDNFRPAVEKANNSSQFLVDVVAATHSGRNTLPESAAIDIVNKNRQLNSLNQQLDSTQQDLSTAESSNQAKDREIASRRQQLSAASAAVALDRALKSAEKDFSKDEAEVYRQGDSLLIRLKGVNFASGRADLPSNSMTTLAKVKDVASELQASRVVVEGHTDSTGTQAVNQQLSEKRAEAVASYLQNNGMDKTSIETIGYGFSRPLTSEKTKAGRATNRRVDIVITPTAQASATPSETMQNTAE